MTQKLNIVCFGEVLWDVFPTHKKIGGAPLNVAIRLQSLGNNGKMASSIGDDENGHKLLDFIKEHGINTDHISINSQFKTGKVKVMVNSKGSASYDIKFPRAWDKISMSEPLKNSVKSADAFIYGSLVARDELSKATLYELLEVSTYNIFDLNLRAPYYTKDVLVKLMERADFIKFNDDELFEVSKSLHSKYNSLEQNIQFISKKTNTKNICVTKGSHGAVLFYEGNYYYNSGYLIKVIDTVGAGDSFLASLMSQLLNGNSPQKSIDFACAVGALVAQCEGANPEISREEIDKFINPYL